MKMTMTMKMTAETKDYESLLNFLKENSDSNYKVFHKKLIATSKADNIGVKSPIIKKVAKELAAGNFKKVLEYPDECYEVVLIKGLIIGYAKTDYKTKLELIENFLPLIDNWAVCDSFTANLKFISRNKQEFLTEIKKYLKSPEEYKVRFGLICLLSFYIEAEYIDYILEVLKGINSDLYYINMAAAWLLSVCFVKQELKTRAVIESKVLSPFIQNKGIQKICESFRVDNTAKYELKRFKI